nr:hypothetical protein [Streptomyces sp. B1I3]
MSRTRPEKIAIVLRESEELGAVLRDALSTAPAGERPGLERALALVERAAAVPDAELRARWVRQRLSAAGYDGPADAVEAVRILRKAEPGLSLLSAVTYSREAAGLE